jgi:hypothetical protein
MEFGTQNQLFGLADLVGDYRFGAPPGQRPMSETTRNKVLDLWAQGKTTGQIQNMVRRDSNETLTQRRSRGQRYAWQTIYNVVSAARDEGDPRAVKRRG